MKRFCLILLLFATVAVSASAAGKGVPLQLAKGGKPCAEIVIPANADVTLKFAAEELQLWISKISGAKLPLVKAEKQNVNQIVLDPAASRFPADAEALKGNDGYSVRSAAGKVYLNASCPKGVLNGVFRMLYKNSDIIWARPHKRKGTFYSVNPDFTLTKTDYIDIPKFLLRGWQFNGSKAGEIENFWQMRNGCNWDFIKPENPLKRKFNSVMEFGGGHNIIHIYMPENKYFASNPEFYSMINGRRERPGRHQHLTQLCFTNLQMTDAFIKEVESRIKVNPQFDAYRILAEDNPYCCECPECVKPVDLGNGKTVGYRDPAFRSTQFFIFLNRIARHLKKHYPGKRIQTYAYWFTAVPPKCMVEDNIDIIICQIRNFKFPLDAPECREVRENYLGWSKVAPSITWRDYYGLYWDFPRPIDVIAFADLRYVAERGTKRTYTEMLRDDYNRQILTHTWNCNTFYFWMMTQGYWDPFQNIDTLRKEFFSRVYGEAAGDVEEYYKLIENAWFGKYGVSLWNDAGFMGWVKYVHETGIEADCRAALERAASKKVSGIRKELIADLRENFEKNMAYAKEQDITIPRTASKVEFDPSFKKAPWQEARQIKKFFVRGTMKDLDPERTVIRLIGDKKNLYIGIEAHVGANRLKDFFADLKDPKAIFPYRECMDVIIHGKWNAKIDYARFFVDPAGNIFSRGRAVGVSAKTGVGKTSWRAMVTVPWEEFAIDPDRDESFRMQVIRHRLPKGTNTIMFAPRDYSIMLGGGYDKKPFFNECKIGK